MDQLGANQKERNHVRALLIKKYGSQNKAAKQMKLSPFTLSRIINGRDAEIESIVKILRASGHLHKSKAYRFPRENWKTFCFVNGINTTSLL